jgi:hypothetical protein
MIDSRRGAEIIDDARDRYADNPDQKIDVDEPRFKGHVGRDNVSFQQGKHDDKENAGEHMCNQLSHTLKIIQIKNISCKKTAKRESNTRLSSKILSFHPYKPLNIGPHYEH